MSSDTPQLQNVRHDYIRYANCWEDADVLLAALQIKSNDRVLSIGSAGDNSFSLLLHNPELVVAVDINKVQLNLIELKKAAIKALSHKEFLLFIGFSGGLHLTKNPGRLELFKKVTPFLSDELTHFWSNRVDLIESGIIYQGKFERYLLKFSHSILPWIHSKKRVQKLFEIESESERIAFFNQEWNTWRWRSLFKIFFSKFVMGRLGRDPQFLKEVKVPVAAFFLNQARKHISADQCPENYFLHFALTGNFGRALPHYARKENYEIIKNNLDQLVTFEGLAEDAFKVYSDFNKFNLSNIFEYMNPETVENVAQNLMENGRKNALYAYWNLLVPRRMSEYLNELKFEQSRSAELREQDHGFFYGNFLVDRKK